MYPRIRTVSAKAVLACALAAVPALAQDAPPQAPAARSQAEVNRPVKSPGNAQWAPSVEEACKRAAAQKKLVFYEFESPDCSDCQRMQSLLYPALDFEALLIGMVPVKVRYDVGESKPLQELYGIATAPSILITTPEGRLVFLMQNFKDAPDFYRHVHKDLDLYRQLDKKLAAQSVDTLSANEAFQIGHELYARKDPKAAMPYLKRASVAPNPGKNVRENALEGLAAVKLELGDPAASRKTIEQLIATTQNADQKERAELFRAQIPLSQNNPEEALALYKKFVEDHPNSKYVERVQSFIARLSPSAPPAP
jgi:tetratricopeptide (TPR) repeat protein